jgi:hypothetical protein
MWKPFGMFREFLSQVDLDRRFYNQDARTTISSMFFGFFHRVIESGNLVNNYFNLKTIGGDGDEDKKNDTHTKVSEFYFYFFFNLIFFFFSREKYDCFLSCLWLLRNSNVVDIHKFLLRIRHQHHKQLLHFLSEAIELFSLSVCLLLKSLFNYLVIRSSCF